MNLATMPPCHTMNTEKSGASVSRVVGRTWLVWVWAESDECDRVAAHVTGEWRGRTNARCGAHVSESTKKTIVILSYATDTDRLTARR